MSENASQNDNPFSRLNKKDFPAARKAFGKIVRRADKPQKKTAEKTTTPPDEDTALFLNAVSSAVRLEETPAARSSRRKRQKASEHETSLPDTASAIPDTHASSARDAEELFNPLPMPSRQALRTRQKTPPIPNTTPDPPRKPAPATREKYPDPVPQQDSFATLLAESMPDGLHKSLRKLPPSSRRETVREDPRETARRERELSRQRAMTFAADDETFFAEAMRNVAPLDGKGRSVQPVILPHPTPDVDANPLRNFMDNKVEFSLASTDEYVEGHVIGLDLITVGKLQAGQFSPEAHIDLHGLNAEQAFQALVSFIKHSYLCGRRTVLVVPGRGLNSPSGIGILRERVQEWFTQDPFRRVILAFCTARKVDGGPGALYVLLRKYKKNNGKVYWNRTPSDPDLCL